MGYIQDCQVDLSIPVDVVTHLSSLMEAAGISRWVEQGDTDDTQLIFEEELLYAIGEHGDFDWEDEFDDGLYRVSGYTSGKVRDTEEALLTLLAKHGVTGTVDGIGEDGTIWRYRLSNTELSYHPGVITYPSDQSA